MKKFKVRALTEQEKARIECKKYFKENESKTNEWRNWETSMDDFADYNTNLNYNTVDQLIKFYIESGVTTEEIDATINFILKVNGFGESDNSMWVALNTAYYYCVNALIEWLENMVIERW